VIAGATNELFVNPGAEAAIRRVLVECCGPSLDAVKFGNAAGVPQQQPPSLLYNITPLSASGAAGNKALYEDLENLGTAVAPVSGNGGVVVVASPK
jgi:hypothetical protein